MWQVATALDNADMEHFVITESSIKKHCSRAWLLKVCFQHLKAS